MRIQSLSRANRDLWLTWLGAGVLFGPSFKETHFTYLPQSQRGRSSSINKNSIALSMVEISNSLHVLSMVSPLIWHCLSVDFQNPKLRSICPPHALGIGVFCMEIATKSNSKRTSSSRPGFAASRTLLMLQQCIFSLLFCSVIYQTRQVLFGEWGHIRLCKM